MSIRLLTLYPPFCSIRTHLFLKFRQQVSEKLSDALKQSCRSSFEKGMEIMSDVKQQRKVDELKEIFKSFDVRIHPEKYRMEYPEGIFRKASVLIPVCVMNGEYHVILTLRSEKLTHHAGYVAFPGGMQDDTDTDEIHTALREAKEEIGLEPEDVEVICVVSQGIVKPNSLVTPVVGLVRRDFEPVINEDEVSLVFKLPLKRFLSSDRRRISDFPSLIDATYHIYHFIDNINGQEVDTWGYTAMLCVSTALVIFKSDKLFNFYENVVVNKETAFEPTGVRQIIEKMMKPASKY